MTTIQFVDESPAGLNGAQGPFVVETPAMKRSSADAGLDSDSDSDNEGRAASETLANSINPIDSGPRPGKKTKGRVKIKMEFIENKLRRYTTFSKRKTGIMKKAYELSTLTGTQVMLLVASETGHVYTFATRKLQPMITSESGKALIQTCLNSPDTGSGGNAAPPTPTQPTPGLDQRMAPGGFEEPELSYGISEDEHIKASDSPSMAQLYSNTLESSPSPSQIGQPMISGLDIKRTSPAPPPAHSGNGLGGLNSFLPTGSPSNTPSPSGGKTSVTTTLGGLSTATQLFLPSTPISSTVGSSVGQQTLQYRLPTPAPGQVVNLPTLPTQNNNIKDNTQTTMSSSSGNPAPPPGTFMYQTPQGVVYATAQGQGVPGVPALPEGYILNLPQTPTLQVPDQQAGGTQQYITIPVPVSLAAGGAQVLQPVIAQAQAAAQAAANSNPSMVQQLSKSK